MKIAITGLSGMIGPEVWNVLKDDHELWGMGRKKPDFVPLAQWKNLDLVESELVSKIVWQINPDCIIHLAALSHPDECEENPDYGYQVNALGTRNLALACQRFDTELLFVSTDQVFGGEKESPYNEMDATRPVNHYGRSKVWAEQFVQTLLRRFYIVRTALVFGAARPSFIDRVAKASLSKEPVTAATDIVNSPTYANDLATAIRHLISSHLYGIYHIANEGHCTRYELAQFVAKTLGRKTDFIVKGSEKKLQLKAKRPGYTPLENKVWHLNGFPAIPTWQDAVSRFLKHI